PGGPDRGDLGDEARDRQRARAPRRAQALVVRLGNRRARADPRDPDGRTATDLGPPGARGRDGHAAGPVLPPGQTLIRVLRPAPDGTADVTGDGRPAGCPLLPRLRPDLLLPEHPDG